MNNQSHSTKTNDDNLVNWVEDFHEFLLFRRDGPVKLLEGRHLTMQCDARSIRLRNRSFWWVLGTFTRSWCMKIKQFAPDTTRIGNGGRQSKRLHHNRFQNHSRFDKQELFANLPVHRWKHHSSTAFCACLQYDRVYDDGVASAPSVDDGDASHENSEFKSIGVAQDIESSSSLSASLVDADHQERLPNPNASANGKPATQILPVPFAVRWSERTVCGRKLHYGHLLIFVSSFIGFDRCDDTY